VSVFDSHRKAQWKSLTGIMGEDGSWSPSIGGPTLEARVLIREISEIDIISGVEFTPLSFIIEYENPFFPGLWDAVTKHNRVEQIKVNEVYYHIRTIEAFVDGNIFKCMVERLTAPL